MARAYGSSAHLLMKRETAYGQASTGVQVAGARLAIRTCAEGVETAEQVAMLQREGCDELQGYYFSHAVHPAELTAMLDETHAEAQALGPGQVSGAA